jgi:uncharacterized repeat protein (TIGR03803 family)
MTIRLLTTSLLGATALSLSAHAQTTVQGPITYSPGQPVTVIGPSTIQTSGQVMVSSGENVRFLATSSISLNAGFSSSGATFAATVEVLPPSFSPAAGVFTAPQSVTITDAVSGTTIFYTTDGSLPTTASKACTGAVSISSTQILRAVAVTSTGTSSPATSGYYTINLPPAGAPSVSLSSGSYTGTQTVTITGGSGGNIYYTTDGSTPTQTNGTLYTGPIFISSTTVLKAVAVGAGESNSPVAAATYTMTNSPAAAINVMDSFSAANAFGIDPGAALIQGADGNYYGTTEFGNDSAGTVFQMTPAGALAVMALLNGSGSLPCTALMQGTDGNFYGTTLLGGGSNDGTVFQLTPAGTLTTLVSFTSANGAYPQAALVQGSDGNFYGTTVRGGNSDAGTAFKVTPAGVLTTLVSFTGANGANPQAALVQGSDGNFYGTTFYGGSDNAGTVFKMTPTGALNTLVSFGGKNGALPGGALAPDGNGNFYGTTEGGGTNNDGTVFQLSSADVVTTLLSFNGTDGSNPDAGLTLALDGNFYGTTETGGASGLGTVFQVTPENAVNVLVSFDGANGANPIASLLQGNDGNLYGTTYAGGDTNDGVIFQILETPVPATTLSPSTINIAFGQTATLTATTVELDGNLTSQTIDYLAPGSSTWVSGTTVSGASWIGGPTGSYTLTWPIPNSVLNAVGTWQFRASGSNGTQTSAYATAAVVVAKATPTVLQWSNQDFINSNTVTQAELDALFDNPYAGSGVALPNPADITYYIITNTGTTPLTVGTVLPPGTYTVGVSFSGDNNYNPYTPPTSVTWTEQLGETFQYDADSRLITVQQASTASPGTLFTINFGLDPELNILSVNPTSSSTP